MLSHIIKYFSQSQDPQYLTLYQPMFQEQGVINKWRGKNYDILIWLINRSKVCNMEFLHFTSEVFCDQVTLFLGPLQLWKFFEICRPESWFSSILSRSHLPVWPANAPLYRLNGTIYWEWNYICSVAVVYRWNYLLGIELCIVTALCRWNGTIYCIRLFLPFSDTCWVIGSNLNPYQPPQ